MNANEAPEPAKTDRLKEENARLRSENEHLRTMLGLAQGFPPDSSTSQSSRLFPEDIPLPKVNSQSTPAEKIELFRALFRGRDDVYARFWSDERTGKKGYSPAVAGGHKRSNDAKSYLPLTDDVFFRHLAGEHIVGLYPLLQDDTCLFLACDFDGATWAPDALGFLEVADRWRIPAYLERSRSGQGGHVWIFFTRPVSAVHARRLGASLLRETMVVRAELELASYDRLFPNQDFMPKGGFGNLIALPLQKKARARRNTEFVNRELKPWLDPWRGLSHAQRLSPEELEALLEELPPVTVGFDGSSALSAFGRGMNPEPPLPERITCVRGAQLSIERSGLRPSLLARLKHLASLNNPEYYKRQKLRLSIYGTPRFVRCYDEDLTHLHLPRGILASLENIVRDAGSQLEVEETRINPGGLVLSLGEPLSPLQSLAVRDLVQHDEGILVAPPGAGKTRMACAVIAARNAPTLILVHRKPILDQWRLELQTCLGLKPKEIGQFGAGRKRRSRVVDLAMIQSFRSEESWQLLRDYGQIVVDECHHLPAVSFDGLIKKAPARFVLGLTATPYRRDGLGDLIMMRCGPVRHCFEDGSRGPGGQNTALDRRLIVRQTAFDPELVEESAIQEVYRALIENDDRNHLICTDVQEALARGARCLVLTEWREHLAGLAEELEARGAAVVILHGGLKKKERQTRIAMLKDAPIASPTLVLATGQLVGEGFDLPRLDTLFLPFPISFKGKIIQYVGRILRSHPEKRTVTVFDYNDSSVPVLMRMQSRRQKTLNGVGFVADSGGNWKLGEKLEET